jgi:hypothetical protein
MMEEVEREAKPAFAARDADVAPAARIDAPEVRDAHARGGFEPLTDFSAQIRLRAHARARLSLKGCAG